MIGKREIRDKIWENVMNNQLSGPCCVLGAAMNYREMPATVESPGNNLFQIIVALVGAIGFVALFIL